MVKHMARSGWSRPETIQLISMHQQGLKWNEIAKKLRRNKRSCFFRWKWVCKRTTATSRYRRCQGLRRRARRWRPQEVRLLMDMRRKGKSWIAIGRLLDRNILSCRVKHLDMSKAEIDDT